MPQMNWRNIALLLIGVVFLIYLSPILNTISGILTDGFSAMRITLGRLAEADGGRDSNTFALVRLCVFLIFVVGVIKLLMRPR